MMTIPATEQSKFISLIKGNATLFAMTPEDYLRKVWYHEEASKVGEFVALSLLDHLLGLLPVPAEASVEERGLANS